MVQRARKVGFVAFDTLKYAEKLEKSGFSREQSVMQAEAQLENRIQQAPFHRKKASGQ